VFGAKPEFAAILYWLESHAHAAEHGTPVYEGPPVAEWKP
jgi:hypothetical protein